LYALKYKEVMFGTVVIGPNMLEYGFWRIKLFTRDCSLVGRMYKLFDKTNGDGVSSVRVFNACPMMIWTAVELLNCGFIERVLMGIPRV
jgi:hypothetical protein